MLVSYTWDVTVPASTVSGVGAGAVGGSISKSVGAGAGADPLGCGITRPFHRASSDFATASGVPKVLACVGQLLGTELGSIPWRPGFGTRFVRLRHKANNAVLAEIARVDAANALSRWEPRAKLQSLDVDQTSAGGGRNEKNVLSATAAIRIAGKSKTLRVPI